MFANLLYLCILREFVMNSRHPGPRHEWRGVASCGPNVTLCASADPRGSPRIPGDEFREVIFWWQAADLRAKCSELDLHIFVIKQAIVGDPDKIWQFVYTSVHCTSLYLSSTRKRYLLVQDTNILGQENHEQQSLNTLPKNQTTNIIDEIAIRQMNQKQKINFRI